MSGCGHRCCDIPLNGYHSHTGRPATCSRCARALESTPGTGHRESYLLGRVIADVLARIAPEIPGLPTGVELTELVASHALAIYAAGLVDPDVQRLPERDRRRVLAGRIGLALAFPD